MFHSKILILSVSGNDNSILYVLHIGRVNKALSIPRGYKNIDAEPLSEEKQRELVHSYYASISYTDAQRGKVLAALDRLGLTNNTIIVLWSDHGFHLGEKGTGYQSASNYYSSRQKEWRQV